MSNSEHRSRTTRAIMRALLLAVLLSLLGYLTYLAVTVHNLTRPLAQAVCCETPDDYGLAYEEVVVASCDDTVLAGWYIPAENGSAIILLHEEEEIRTGVLAEAVELAAAGYGVLLYDRRGHGESSQVLRAHGWDDLGDLYNAWDWLAARPEIDEERIGVYGKGVGGQIALRGAAFSRRIYAVAAERPAPATSADLTEATVTKPATLNEQLLFQGVARRTGIPEPFAVVEVIQDIAPRPLLLLGTGEGESAENAVVRHYYEQAHEPKALAAGGETRDPSASKQALAAFFDEAQMTLDVAER